MTIKERLLLEAAKDLLKQIEDSENSIEVRDLMIQYLKYAVDQYETKRK